MRSIARRAFSSQSSPPPGKKSPPIISGVRPPGRPRQPFRRGQAIVREGDQIALCAPEAFLVCPAQAVTLAVDHDVQLEIGGEAVIGCDHLEPVRHDHRRRGRCPRFHEALERRRGADDRVGGSNDPPPDRLQEPMQQSKPVRIIAGDVGAVGGDQRGASADLIRPRARGSRRRSPTGIRSPTPGRLATLVVIRTFPSVAAFPDHRDAVRGRHRARGRLAQTTSSSRPVTRC